MLIDPGKPWWSIKLDNHLTSFASLGLGFPRPEDDSIDYQPETYVASA